MKAEIILYNPFEPLTVSLVKEMISEGYKFLVLQRFAWPGIALDKSFMATAYQDNDLARQHVTELSEKEGKMLDLMEDYKKIEELILSKNFRLYLNTVKDENWTGKIIKSYKMKIAGYVRSRTQIRASEGVEIELKFKWGRLVAMLRSGELEYEVPAYELIK